MYTEDIKKITKDNINFRKVLHTGVYSQIVAMSIPIGGDIGEEVHPQTDQLVFLVEGEGQAITNGEIKNIEEHDVVFIPAGTIHNIKNTGDEDLKLFTIYAPPEHSDGVIHKTKEEAEQEEKE